MVILDKISTLKPGLSVLVPSQSEMDNIFIFSRLSQRLSRFPSKADISNKTKMMTFSKFWLNFSWRLMAGLVPF